MIWGLRKGASETRRNEGMKVSRHGTMVIGAGNCHDYAHLDMMMTEIG